MSLATTVVLWGIGLGILLGVFASKTNFCTMGAVSDIVNMGSWGRMRAWILAIAVAIIGTNLLSYMGYLDLSKTIYTGASFPILTFIAGGFIFGIGMTLASGCGNKTLLRIGSGNLKSLVVFVFMGFSAIATLKGILGSVRVNVLTNPVNMQFDHSQTIPSFFSIGGLDAGAVQMIVAGAITLALVIFVFMSKEFRHEIDNSIAGISIGLIVIAAWYVTGHIGYAENPETMEMVFMGASNTAFAESMSFVAPSAFTLEYLGYWTDSSRVVTFGIASAFGVVLGSFIYSKFTNGFRWEYFTSAKDMGYHIIGAIMMGFGGVTAMGCTVGQGISGISTLSLGSLLALLSIIAGSAITMKIQYYMMMRED